MRLAPVTLAVFLFLPACSDVSDGEDASPASEDRALIMNEDAAALDAERSADVEPSQDAASTCSGVNPSRADYLNECWPGRPGLCCGDVISEMLCVDGEWQCPAQHAPLWQCGTHCEFHRG